MCGCSPLRGREPIKNRKLASRPGGAPQSGHYNLGAVLSCIVVVAVVPGNYGVFLETIIVDEQVLSHGSARLAAEARV